MFGIGATELIIIMVVALLVFGPKRLPELARSLGRGMAEFRRASSDLRQTLQEVDPEADSTEPKEQPAAPAIQAPLESASPSNELAPAVPVAQPPPPVEPQADNAASEDEPGPTGTTGTTGTADPTDPARG